MNQSNFTVIIPVYNGVRFLREAVESVWDQTEPPSEIIIVDDCSTDNSLELAVALQKHSPIPMRIFKMPRNSGGPAQPINFGVREAKTEYLAVLDQDDLFHPDRLHLHNLALSSIPEATVVFGLVASTTDPDVILQGDSARKQLIEHAKPILAEHSQLFTISPRRVTELLFLLGNFTYGFPGFSFRRIGFASRVVDDKLRICVDLELLFYLASHGSFVVHTSIAYRRREHSDNLTCNQLVTNYEEALLRAKYLMAHGWLDQAIKLKTQKQLEGMAYWAQEAGHPLKSIRLYAALGRVTEWNNHVIKGILSALPVYLFRTLTFQHHRQVAMTSTNRKLAVKTTK